MPTEKKKNVVSVTVVLRRETHEKLKLAAKASGHSMPMEAMLRLTQHLNTVPELSKDSYWEILLPKNES